MLTRHTPSPTWRLRSVSGNVPANIDGREFDAPVPGDVHTALRHAEAIPHPAIDNNEHLVDWIGRTDWEYRTTLRALDESSAQQECIELVFHGVDTIATASIDGVERGASRNMHRTWRIPVPELREGDASLSVHLASPVIAAQQERERIGARPSAFSVLPPFIRKKACDFGWDWGPSLPGAGIWRAVFVESWSIARLDGVRPTATVSFDGPQPRGRVDIDIDIVRAASAEGTELEIVARLGGQETVMEVTLEHNRVRGSLTIDDPRLWWPAGLGEQELYDLDVVLRGGGHTLDSHHTRIGFRELTVEQAEDADGSAFGITVNGVPLFVRGFNWIPEDTSISSVSESDYRRRVNDALDLGANLLRVWGGGVFESDEFYRACDEAGMLVWQDFLFACAAYPEEDPFTDEVQAEARDNVTRLMPHPSLALWNGNNENLWFWFLHDWEKNLDGASWGEGFYFDVLPRVVADLDPSRSYLVGSPSSGGRWQDPNDPSRGVVHLWVPDDYRAYDDTRARFVSEFGFQGPPSRTTFREAVHEEKSAPFSPGVVQRQKAEGGTERINTVLAMHFGVPREFDEWYWLAQLNQARAVRYGVERFRTLEPFCRGTILWQLNDCWPALSWSVIDVADRWKPAAFAVREAFRDRIVVLRFESDGAALFACNSTTTPWEARIDVQRMSPGGQGHAVEVRATVPPHSSVRLPLDDLFLTETELTPHELLVATTLPPGETRVSRSVLLAKTDREFPDVNPIFALDIQRSSGQVTVRITADVLIRDIVVAADELDPDARCDVNLVTLLPGEDAHWTIQTTQPELFTEDATRALIRVARAASEHDSEHRNLAQLEREKAAAALTGNG